MRVVPWSTYTSFELPVHTVRPVRPLLEHEFTGPAVPTTVAEPTLGSSGTTATPVVVSDQLPSGTYAVTAVPWISIDKLDVGRHDAATPLVAQVPAVQVVPLVHTVPQEPQLF